MKRLQEKFDKKLTAAIDVQQEMNLKRKECYKKANPKRLIKLQKKAAKRAKKE